MVFGAVLAGRVDQRPHMLAPFARLALCGGEGGAESDEVNHQGHVLIVSSGGPIATAVGHVLGAPPETIVELNMRLRNSAVTELVFSPKRHSLLSFNTLPHLDSAEHAGWVTYA